MKYCTDDFAHYFDSADECLRYEKLFSVSRMQEKRSLFEKINEEIIQLEQLLHQYNVLTNDEIQISTFDGKIVTRQISKHHSAITEFREIMKENPK